MRASVCGALVALSVTAWAVGNWPATIAASAQPAVAGAGQELFAFASPTDDHGQLLIVLDPRTRVVSVYHVSPKGELALRSVRNIDADLRLSEYNGVSPLPHEIRSMLDRGRSPATAGAGP